MAKLKVIKHEEKNGRLIVTVERTSFWGKKTIGQFIDSDYIFTKFCSDGVWFTYPDFIKIGWLNESEYHHLLTGWKRGYEFYKSAEDGK